MFNQRLRLVFLRNALTPGVSGRLLSIDPAGQATETRMAQALQYPPCFDRLPVFISQGDLSQLFYISSRCETHLN